MPHLFCIHFIVLLIPGAYQLFNGGGGADFPRGCIGVQPKD